MAKNAKPQVQWHEPQPPRIGTNDRSGGLGMTMVKARLLGIFGKRGGG